MGFLHSFQTAIKTHWKDALHAWHKEADLTGVPIAKSVVELAHQLLGAIETVHIDREDCEIIEKTVAELSKMVIHSVNGKQEYDIDHDYIFQLNQLAETFTQITTHVSMSKFDPAAIKTSKEQLLNFSRGFQPERPRHKIMDTLGGLFHHDRHDRHDHQHLSHTSTGTGTVVTLAHSDSFQSPSRTTTVTSTTSSEVLRPDLRKDHVQICFRNYGTEYINVTWVDQDGRHKCGIDGNIFEKAVPPGGITELYVKVNEVQTFVFQRGREHKYEDRYFTTPQTLWDVASILFS